LSEWALKRFWTTVDVAPCDGGCEVLLDGRRVKTPAKRALVLPTQRVADEVAREWGEQVETVDPTTMPWTRSANAALDKVAPQRDEVTAHLADYAGTDLLSYRAAGPQALTDRQAELWDPILAWLDGKFHARLNVTSGVMPIIQSPDVLARLAAAMTPMSDFQLTGFYDLVTLTGSYAIALAATEGYGSAESLWALSRLDESFQIEQWGDDEEAAEHAAIKKSAFLHANDFFHSA
jgi:chaperone required for assembly of F1-ATPase